MSLPPDGFELPEYAHTKAFNNRTKALNEACDQMYSPLMRQIAASIAPLQSITDQIAAATAPMNRIAAQADNLRSLGLSFDMTPSAFVVREYARTPTVPLTDDYETEDDTEVTAIGDFPLAMIGATRSPETLTQHWLYDSELTVIIDAPDADSQTIAQTTRRQIERQAQNGHVAALAGLICDKAVLTEHPYVAPVNLTADEIGDRLGLKMTRKRDRTACASAIKLLGRFKLIIKSSSALQQLTPIPFVIPVLELDGRLPSARFAFGDWRRYCSDNDFDYALVPSRWNRQRSRDQFYDALIHLAARGCRTIIVGDLLVHTYGRTNVEHKLCDRKRRSELRSKTEKTIARITHAGIAALSSGGRDWLETEIVFASLDSLDELKPIRSLLGLSQLELAKHLHVDRSIVSKIENGRRELTLHQKQTIARLIDAHKARHTNRHTLALPKTQSNRLYRLRSG